jgi:hypothetical protein
MRFPRLRKPVRFAALGLMAVVLAWIAGKRFWPDGPPAPATNPGNARAVMAADAHEVDGSQTATLENALDLARNALATLETIDDYTCTFIKRERVDGKLLDQEKLAMKLRHQPFSARMRFIEPESAAGQQAIYVEGQNGGKLLGHTTGLAGKVMGWVPLDPKGYLAMRGNRYAITDSGMKNLVQKLITLGETPGLLDGCTVEFDDEATVDERRCICVEISMPKPKTRPKRKNKIDFTLASARIFVDREWGVPVRFETHEWPDGNSEPRLVEQYTYLDLEFNQGLTDVDFDPTNPAYASP